MHAQPDSFLSATATGGSYSRFPSVYNSCLAAPIFFFFFFSFSLPLHFLHIIARSSSNGGEPCSSEKSKPTLAADRIGLDHRDGRERQTKERNAGKQKTARRQDGADGWMRTRTKVAEGTSARQRQGGERGGSRVDASSICFSSPPKTNPY